MAGGSVTSTSSWSGPVTSAPGLEISAFAEPAGLRLNYLVRNLSGVRVEHCNLLPTVDGRAVSTSKVLFGPIEAGGVATVTFHFKGAYKVGQQLHPDTEMDFDYKGGSGHLADQKPVFVQ
ncbi:hypothetical protein [Fimbriimonas ginsengisoli]|uniref:hypothetical protein n=1 Tax=Fimbriimonas ginsengisoli TaxID=1005039 RepID=UPI001185E9F5|nr:hypothetical protein [Fimbriimonas ginsengisoli]